MLDVKFISLPILVFRLYFTSVSYFHSSYLSTFITSSSIVCVSFFFTFNSYFALPLTSPFAFLFTPCSMWLSQLPLLDFSPVVDWFFPPETYPSVFLPFWTTFKI